MFSFFKKKKFTVPDTLDGVVTTVESMGYKITEHGKTHAITSLNSKYKAAEVASHIILVTIALDVRESSGENANLANLMGIAQTALGISKMLKFFVENDLMHPTQWQNDKAALIGISIVGPEQLDWVEKVLSDPMVGAHRLARQLI